MSMDKMQMRGQGTKPYETRAYEVRAHEEQPLVLEGMAVVFDQPAKVGGYTECISRSALDGVSLDDVALLVNHDGAGVPLARSPKTLSLTVTDAGLHMRAELPDTEAGRSVYQAVKRGDLSQMSFAFDVAEQDVNVQKRIRTITKIGKLYEISVVNFAAYKHTNISARAEQGGESDMHNHISNNPGSINPSGANPGNGYNPIESAVFG